MKRATPRTARLAGLTLGAIGGFLVLEGPIFGLGILIAAAVLVRAAGQALAGSAGILLGAGAAWLALLGRVKLECIADPAQSCPTIDAYLGVAVVLLCAGLSLAIVAARQARGQGVADRP